jgi:FAD/FMN-containing dehydrogenase
LDELDELVLKYGGRVYLTKDVRMTHEMLVNSYPQAQSFIDKIQELDPEFKFASAQSERIEMTNSKL